VFRVLLLLGLVIEFWWLILAVLALIALGFLWAVRMHLDSELERWRREDAALVARADQQHAQVLAGDERGVPPLGRFRCRAADLPESSRHRAGSLSSARAAAAVSPIPRPLKAARTQTTKFCIPEPLVSHQ
jgi:hypothetical protein